jgi:hypothetical protein
VSIPVTARSKTWVCGRSLAGIVSSNPAGGMDISLSCKCCVLSGRVFCVGLITRPEESYRLWCVVVCDREASILKRSGHTTGCCAMTKKTPEACVICEVETSLNRLGEHLEKAASPAKPVISVAAQFTNSTEVRPTKSQMKIPGKSQF